MLCIAYVSGNNWNQFWLGKSGVWDIYGHTGGFETCEPHGYSSDQFQGNASIPDFIDKHNFLCCRDIERGIIMSGHALSAFKTAAKLSSTYRKLLLRTYIRLPNPSVLELGRSEFFVLRICVVPCKQRVDYAWGERVERLVLERMELGNTMSWLSTFGGAFSALGEEVKDCALIAGRISVKQLSIAIRLGDPLQVARSKLYLALSLIQQGRLSRARRIIEEQYRTVKSLPVIDNSVIRMCQGIWAKLKYSYQLRRARLKYCNEM
ncbi:hypothetical protein PR048_004197 [Dryococelus australis]|uniref:Uncharacterized protein n=1 Tax=Dryococelus australis TaxID=614101 RepID=A0ABQ9I5Z4_9NEOP|nr:hypothetical protein PR048_004197 [Dryococelus australis]